MKERKITQIEIIQETDALTFKKKVNDRMREIEDVIELTFPNGNGFCAMIKYNLIEQTPEDAADRYYLEYGKHYCCNDCPLLELDPDRRSVTHWCNLHEDRVRLKSSCCDEFYIGLMSGKYHLVTPAERKQQFERMDREELERRKLFRSELEKTSRAKRATLKAEKELLKIKRKQFEIDGKL